MTLKELMLNSIKGDAVSDYQYKESIFGFSHDSDEWLEEVNFHATGSDEWLTYKETILELRDKSKRINTH